jgi:hypothetical protein
MMTPLPISTQNLLRCSFLRSYWPATTCNVHQAKTSGIDDTWVAGDGWIIVSILTMAEKNLPSLRK